MKIFKAIATVGGAILGGPLGAVAAVGIGTAATALLSKSPKVPVAPPAPTRDDAAAAAARRDDRARRKGTAANVLLGEAGAEAPAQATATTKLLGA